MKAGVHDPFVAVLDLFRGLFSCLRQRLWRRLKLLREELEYLVGQWTEREKRRGRERLGERVDRKGRSKGGGEETGGHQGGGCSGEGGSRGVRSENKAV